MLMLSKNKVPIQLLKPFYCYTKCVAMHSALVMMAAENKSPTRRKLLEKSNETVECVPINSRMYANDTVECMPMKLFGATDIAERMLQTYFSTWHELRQADICVYKLQTFPKKPTIYR